MLLLHPATSLLLFVIAAVFAYAVPLAAVTAALLLFCLIALARGQLQRVARMLWRLRYIFLCMALAVWLTPPASQDKTQLFAASAARLALVVSALVVLVLALPRERLLSGLQAMLTWLGHVGMPSERALARIALTLQYSETLTTRNFQQLLQQLDHPPQHDGTTLLTLQRHHVRWQDIAALSLAALALASAL